MYVSHTSFLYLKIAEMTSVGQSERNFDKALSSKCILTPFNACGIKSQIVSLSRYMEERGNTLSEVDLALITRDVQEAATYLKSISVHDDSITTEKIALQLVRFSNSSD